MKRHGTSSFVALIITKKTVADNQERLESPQPAVAKEEKEERYQAAEWIEKSHKLHF